MNIAIIKLSSLGDIIHASASLALIKKYIKDARISWFADLKFGKILNHCALLDEIILLPLKEKNYKKSFEILKQYQNKFDLIIDLQGLIKSSIIARILGKNIYGFSYKSAKEGICSILYAHKFKSDYNENVILRNANLCAFGLKFTYQINEIINKNAIFTKNLFNYENLQKDKILINNENLSNKNYILIAPFASEQSKCYAHFDKVIKILKSSLKNYEILIIQNGDNELIQAKKIAQISSAKVLKILDFSKLITLINNASILIGNDSGISHLAWAQNTATITLFGNRPSQRNALLTTKNLVIDSGKKIDAKKINKNDFCINEIKPEIIANTAFELIKILKNDNA